MFFKCYVANYVFSIASVMFFLLLRLLSKTVSLSADIIFFFKIKIEHLKFGVTASLDPNGVGLNSNPALKMSRPDLKFVPNNDNSAPTTNNPRSLYQTNILQNNLKF